MVPTKSAKTPKVVKEVAAKSAPVKVARKTNKEPKIVPEEKILASESSTEAKEATSERYWEAVGRRKTAIARVRLYTRGDKGSWVNSKTMAEYFHNPYLEKIAAEAIEMMNSADRFRVMVKVKGGGLHAQAEALRHGTARALVLFNPDFRKRLKRGGFITRDPRMKERKKFGLKKARKAPQWAKR